MGIISRTKSVSKQRLDPALDISAPAAAQAERLEQDEGLVTQGNWPKALCEKERSEQDHPGQREAVDDGRLDRHVAELVLDGDPRHPPDEDGQSVEDGGHYRSLRSQEATVRRPGAPRGAFPGR